MSLEKHEVVIVGSGFAGIVAANLLADHGVDVLLIDENIHLGGQLLRAIPTVLGEGDGKLRDPLKEAGFRFVEAIRRKKIIVMNQTRILGIYPELEMLAEADERSTFSIKPTVLLLATGARERFLPFPGWTLPGVIAAGAMQVLSKSSGVLPAPRILIGGSGLFLLAAAYECIGHQGQVQAVLEHTALIPKLRMAGQLVRMRLKLGEGARIMSGLLRRRVPMRYRTKILAASGENELREVLTARVNDRGVVSPGSERTYRTSSLAVSYGFVPNVELAQLAGCRLYYEAGRGGWVTAVGETMETSMPNIFAAGEITGVAGAQKAMIEGQIAALAILQRVGRLSEEQCRHPLHRLQRQLRQQLHFGRSFNTLYGPSRHDYRQIPDETVICRCEDVTMGDIRRAVQQGFATPVALKQALRVGMGDCQGRTCTAVILEILAALTDAAPETIPLPTVRPPIKPASTASLANYF